MLHFIALCFLPLGFSLASFGGTDVPLLADAHTIASGAPKNFGASPVLTLKGAGGRIHIKFDLTTLPAGTTGGQIEVAQLQLFVAKVSKAGAMDVARAAADWSEKTVHSGNAPALGTTEATNIPIDADDKFSFVTVDITNLFRAWVDGTQSNFGVAIVPSAGSPLTVDFDSKENVKTGHEPALRVVIKPVLTVGATGPAGPQGPQGVPGPQGDVGPQGVQGTAGSQGAQGVKGDKGDKGDTGLQGATGAQGAQGLQGPQGDAGPQGVQGLTGSQGIQGIKGDKGDKGDTGLQGATGAQGPQGLQGPQGDVGPQGVQGTTGSQGIQGVKGDKGDTGLQGTPGIQGVKGDKGDKGDTGDTGLQGAPGNQGIQGVPGQTGPQGPPGAGVNSLRIVTEKWDNNASIFLPSTAFTNGRFLVFDGSHIWAFSSTGFVTKFRASDMSVELTNTITFTGEIKDGLYNGVQIVLVTSGGNVVRIKASDGTSANFAIATNVIGIKFDGMNYYGLFSDGSITRMNSSFTAVASSNLGGTPKDFVYDGQFLWVAHKSLNKLTKVDTITLLSAGFISINSPELVAFDGGHLWVVDSQNNKVRKFDKGTQQEILGVDVPAGATDIAVDGTMVWINCEGSSSFNGLLASTGQFMTNFAAGVPVLHMASDGRNIFTIDNDSVDKR